TTETSTLSLHDALPIYPDAGTRPGGGRGSRRVRIVLALGGNALLRRSEPMTAEVQRRNARIAAEAMAPLAADHELVVAHGNGPRSEEHTSELQSLAYLV